MFPFHVEAIEDGTIKISTIRKNTATFLYSFDNKTWEDWDYLTEKSLKAGDRFYIKAKTTNNHIDGSSFVFSNKVNLRGNIQSLLTNENFVTSDTALPYCFQNLFMNNKTIIDASKLVLPATIVRGNAYDSMFCDCTSLVKAPLELPGTTINYSYSYFAMFSGCTSLKTTPIIKSTKMPMFCCFCMFAGCTSMDTVVYLPATTIDPDCYLFMFTNCPLKEIHYPKAFQDDSTFKSMSGSPRFASVNPTIYFDL